MKTFNMSIHRKYTIWQVADYLIEATTKEEAVSIMRAKIDNSEEFEEGSGFVRNEILDETEEAMTPQENDGQSTIEIYVDYKYKSKPLWKNAK